MIRFRSIQFKFGVLYIAILTLILVLFSGFLYFSARYVLYRQLDHELLEKAHELSEVLNLYIAEVAPGPNAVIVASRRVIRLEGIPPKYSQHNQMEARLLSIVDKYNLENDFVDLINTSGISVVHSNNPFPDSLQRFLKSKNATLMRGPLTSPEYATHRWTRVIHYPVLLRDGKHYILQIATSTAYADRLFQEWAFFILLAVPIAVILASFVSRLFVEQILYPVQQMAKTAEKISHEDLSLRVHTPDADEEMQKLAAAFNDMIGRLESSFRHIQEFSFHVAHELKTPLAILRGESEIALRKDRSPEEYRRVLEVSVREAERMVKVIEDMLLLARIEYEAEGFHFDTMDLRAFLTEIYEQSQMLAQAKQISVSWNAAPGTYSFRGDALHLRRLFFNLIDNAIKFTPSQGALQMTLERDGNLGRIKVSDSGVGILPEDLPKIFDKFFHRDRNGSESRPGNGLGLSIARLIVQAHQGDISVESHPGHGTTFFITLPLL